MFEFQHVTIIVIIQTIFISQIRSQCGLWAHRLFFTQDKNFGLSQIGGDIEWQFKPGLLENKLVSIIEEFSLVKPPPYLFIIHCGGNGLGQVPGRPYSVVDETKYSIY